MFKLGKVVMTNGVYRAMEFGGFDALSEIISAFNRYKMCDWGDLSDSDKRLNDYAVKDNEYNRILARYNLDVGDIYIITEADRSCTTILFVEEY